MNRMDNQNLLRRNRPEDGTKIDTRGNVNMSLLNAESIFSIPKSISSISQFAYNDALLVYDLESGLQYGVLKGNGMYYYFESSADENRVVTADLENRRLEVYVNQGWKIHVMGVTLPRIRGFSYVTWQVFAILPINAMVAK